MREVKKRSKSPKVESPKLTSRVKSEDHNVGSNVKEGKKYTLYEIYT